MTPDIEHPTSGSWSLIYLNTGAMIENVVFRSWNGFYPGFYTQDGSWYPLHSVREAHR